MPPNMRAEIISNLNRVIFYSFVSYILIIPVSYSTQNSEPLPEFTRSVSPASDTSNRVRETLRTLNNSDINKEKTALEKFGLDKEVVEAAARNATLNREQDSFAVGVILGSFIVSLNTDPWVSYRYEYTNLSNEPLNFLFALNMQLDPRIGGTIFHESFLDIQVFDTNNSGSASFTSAYLNNTLDVLDIDFGPGGDVIQDSVSLPGSGSIADIFSSDGLVTAVNEPLSLFDLAAELEDSGAETVETGNFRVGGTLSAGDKFIIDGFTCFNNEAKFCPEALQEVYRVSNVPIPGAAWLFGSALLGLVWKSRKTRQSIA